MPGCFQIKYIPSLNCVPHVHFLQKLPRIKLFWLALVFVLGFFFLMLRIRSLTGSEKASLNGLLLLLAS